MGLKFIVQYRFILNFGVIMHLFIGKNLTIRKKRGFNCKGRKDFIE